MLASAPVATSAHAFVRLLTEPRVFIPAIVLAWFLTRRARFTWKRRARERLVHNWSTITATIEVTTAVNYELMKKPPFYVATLTYFYRNPDLQTGDYKRQFGVKDQAKAWAAQFKGRTVLVHVNPNDPSDSVLLERDLAGNDLVTHVPAAPPSENWQAMPQVISPGFRLLCAVAEVVGLAGLATSAVMLTVSIATHGKLSLRGFLWIGGFMLAWCWLSAIAMAVRLGRTEEGRWLMRSYKQWCPGWMRWSLNFTGSVSAFAPLMHVLNLFDVSVHLAHYFEHQPWAHAIAPHLPYAIGCWIFFVSTAFLAAILRSQEELRVLVAQV